MVLGKKISGNKHGMISLLSDRLTINLHKVLSYILKVWVSWKIQWQSAIVDKFTEILLSLQNEHAPHNIAIV